MNAYLIIKEEKVVNAVLWDGVSDWAPPEGTIAELAPAHVGIGWTRVAGEWVAPEPVTVPLDEQALESARAKLAALGLTEEEIGALLK